MPIYDFKCTNKQCEKYNIEIEELCKVDHGCDCTLCTQPLERIKFKSPTVPKVPHVSWSQWRAV